MFFQNSGCCCNNKNHKTPTVPTINCNSLTYALQPECEISALTMDLSANTNCAMVCDFVTYTLTITNNCSSTLNKPVLNINLGDSLCYRLGTLTVDGTTKPDVRCLQNLVLDDLLPQTTVTITFEARVMNNKRCIICNGDLTYSLSCCCQTRCYRTISNDSLVQVCQCCSCSTNTPTV